MINVQMSFDGVLANLVQDESRAKRATAAALNATARVAQASLTKEMETKLDRPTPFTLSSPRIRYAQVLELSASVSLAPIQARYLSPQIAGGARQPKAYERALQGAGLMPAGHKLVPGNGAPLDGFGNVPRAYLAQILAETPRPGSKSARPSRFIAIPLGASAQAGIYLRTPFGPIPLLIFVVQASYEARLDLQKIADAAASSTAEAAFNEAFSK